MNTKPQSGENLVVAKRPSPKGAESERQGGGPLQGTQLQSGENPAIAKRPSGAERKGWTQSPSGVRHLSEVAQSVLHRLLDEQVEPSSIARVVWLQTRERVATGAITRYASRYRKRRQEQQRMRETLDGFIAQARQEGFTTSDLLRAALLEKLSQSQRDGTLKKLDLLALETVERKRGEYELKQKQAQFSAEYKQRELALKERQVRVAEGRFRLDKKKAQAVIERLENKATTGKRLTSDDVRKIREIYGLYQADAELNDEETHTSEAI